MIKKDTSIDLYKVSFVFILTFFINSMSAQIVNENSHKSIPFRVAISTGISIPIGGANVFSEKPLIYKGFNVLKTHNPAVHLAFLAECPWNDNWFMFDSLFVGARFTTQYFLAKNKQFNENLWINTFYLTFSRSLNYKNTQPYARIGIGGSTLLSSLKAFVISGGGSLSFGSRFSVDSHNFALESTINAPLIAYRNQLTAFYELSFLYVFNYDYLVRKEKSAEPSIKF